MGIVYTKFGRLHFFKKVKMEANEKLLDGTYSNMSNSLYIRYIPYVPLRKCIDIRHTHKLISHSHMPSHTQVIDFHALATAQRITARPKQHVPGWSSL